MLSYHKRKPRFINYKQTPIKKPIDASGTVKRLTRKVSPYDKEEFEIISIRAFFSVHIREEDPSTPITIDDASNEVINNLKFEYPDLQKWTNFEIINRIRTGTKFRLI